MTKLFTEALESRLLLSGSPITPFNSTVALDHAQITADLLKFRADLAGNHATLFADLLQIRKDGGTDSVTLNPLVDKYRTDHKSMEAALKSDRLAERKNVFNDEKTILADFKQIRMDKGNTAALSADHAKLLTDRITLQNDMIAGLNSRISSRQAFSTILVNDAQAVVDGVNADATASDALKADVTKWSTDHAAANTRLSDDLTTLVIDRAKLVNDLTAMQSA